MQPPTHQAAAAQSFVDRYVMQYELENLIWQGVKTRHGFVLEARARSDGWIQRMRHKHKRRPE
jgi:hypothetical protein